ncbi:MAG TPA: phosphoadenylyl-sulfate reductase [Firmicutes bacterium]|jgi:phosphoadenosine phosphosulfate reductase|nr:phosphoadenylyl-sulfate reductase [Bacillota bacterium]
MSMATTHDKTTLAGQPPGAPPNTADAAEILQWAVATFNRIALSCSFSGPGGMALAHMLSQIAPQVPVLFINTGFLFPETIALRQLFTQRYAMRVIDLYPALTTDEQAAQYGPDLHLTDPNLCCHLRKVIPMARALDQLDAWITALRRDQGPSRASVKPVEEHLLAGRVVYKINPLANWNKQQVWAYLHKYAVPYNKLLDEGYQSIGCMQCTARIPDAAAEREGRWPGAQKTECGLHTFTQSLS